MAHSRTFYATPSQNAISVKPVENYMENNAVKEYIFDELDYEKNPWIDPTALSVFSNSETRFNKRQKLDDYGYGAYSKN